MKGLLIYPAMIIVLFACNNNKAEREAEIEQATAAAVDSLNDINERIRLEDSMESMTQATVMQAPLPEERTRTGRKTTRKTGTVKGTPEPVNAPAPDSDENTAGTATVHPGEENTGTAGTSTVSPDPEEKKKKGINNTVKGAIIGAGAGAVGGAIINKKNPGKGAVIGGIIGAGAGAVTGVILDKNKKKKAAGDTTSATTTTKEPDTETSGDEEKP